MRHSHFSRAAVTIGAVTRPAGALIAVALVAAACSSSGPDASHPPPAVVSTPPALSGPALARPADIRLPPVNGQFDYQIGGAYPPAGSVAIVDRDRSAEPVAGKYNICYVNAFQSQPEDAAFWKAQHPDLLQRNADGGYIGDPDWPGEILLDTSTAARRAEAAIVVDGWIAGCAAKGFQAVEPDNLDSWTRSHGRLDQADDLAFATLLAMSAHAHGLAIAQKNTGQLGTEGRDIAGLDFAVAEECQQYSECDSYTGPYGTHVIEIEYTDNPRSAYTRACAARGRTITVILRDREVVPEGQSAYRYESC